MNNKSLCAIMEALKGRLKSVYALPPAFHLHGVVIVIC